MYVPFTVPATMLHYSARVRRRHTQRRLTVRPSSAGTTCRQMLMNRIRTQWRSFTIR